MTAAPEQLRVLVVEDDADTGVATATLLRLYGFQVDLAVDCATALSAVEARQPDVVLMDIGLPGCDGYQVAKGLRGRLRTKPLLIASTGYGMRSDCQRSAEEGFDYHLVKPVEPETLRRILREHADRLHRA